MLLGAGRAVKEDVIDPQVGIILHAKVGDAVQEGDTLATLYANQSQVDESLDRLNQALTIDDQAEEAPLIYEIIESA